MKPAFPILALAALFPLSGCGKPKAGDAMKSFLSPRYCQVAESATHRIEIRYLPKTLQLLQRAGLDSSATLTAGMLDSLERAGGGATGLQFLLRIVPKDSARGPGFDGDLIFGKASGYGSFQEAQQAYAFGMKSRIWLEADGRKIPLGRYQMEESFGMTRGRSFLLLFPPVPEGKSRSRFDAELVLDDIVPGLSRKKIQWTFPIGKYDESI